MSPNVQGIVIALVGCAIYSAHDAIIKVLGASLPTVQIAFFVYLLGIPFVVAMLIHDRRPGTLRPVNPGWMALRVVSVLVAVLGAFYAFSVLPLAEAYTILFAAPLLIAVLAVPILGETLRWRRATAVIVGLIGVIVVLRPGAESSGGIGLGHAAALMSAFGNAMVHLTARKIGGQERLPLMILYPMLGIVVLLGLALPWQFAPLTGPAFGALVILALLSFVAMLCLIEGFKRAEAGLVAPMQYSQLIWGVLMGVVFFDEWPQGQTLIGAVLIIGSGLYIVFREARQKPDVDPPAPVAMRRP